MASWILGSFIRREVCICTIPSRPPNRVCVCVLTPTPQLIIHQPISRITQICHGLRQEAFLNIEPGPSLCSLTAVLCGDRSQVHSPSGSLQTRCQTSTDVLQPPCEHPEPICVAAPPKGRNGSARPYCEVKFMLSSGTGQSNGSSTALNLII